jgi:hypothetical protein
MNEKLVIIDLGDAAKETKQGSPAPAVYWDSIWGRGSNPDWP